MSPEKRQHTTVRLPTSYFERMAKIKKKAGRNEILKALFIDADTQSEQLRLVIERGLQFLEAEAFDSTAYIRVGGKDVGSLVALHMSLKESMETVAKAIEAKGYNTP